MRLFFQLCMGYAAISLAAVMLVRDMGVEILADEGYAMLAFGKVVLGAASWEIPFLLFLLLLVGLRRLTSSLGAVGYAIAGSAVFQASFSLTKSSIPFFMPFHADPSLAAFDRWLHGGVDPWVIVHGWASHFPVERLFPIYLTGWSLPALGLVIFLALTDGDRARQKRFVVLFFVCWGILGTIFAIGGASVGPVFFDRLLGGDRFAGLTAALAASPLAGDHLGLSQHYLWDAHQNRTMPFASGISAFPSVHLAVATMTALYMAERSRWLILPGVAFVAVILFLSVYTGYHYAVDGYFSILVVAAAWALLRHVRLAAIEWRPPRLRAERAQAAQR